MRRKGLLIAALVVAALPLLFLGAYRIAAKKLLSGPMLRAEINKKPEEMFIDWDEAVSTWPGSVWLREPPHPGQRSQRPVDRDGPGGDAAPTRC